MNKTKDPRNQGTCYNKILLRTRPKATDSQLDPRMANTLEKRLAPLEQMSSSSIINSFSKFVLDLHLKLE